MDTDRLNCSGFALPLQDLGFNSILFLDGRPAGGALDRAVQSFNVGGLVPMPKGESELLQQTAGETQLITIHALWASEQVSRDVEVVCLMGAFLPIRRCIGCKEGSKAKIIAGSFYCDKHRGALTMGQQLVAFYSRPFAARYIGVKSASC